MEVASLPAGTAPRQGTSSSSPSAFLDGHAACSAAGGESRCLRHCVVLSIYGLDRRKDRNPEKMRRFLHLTNGESQPFLSLKP
nr:unnamed protein product [Digitaria exilis]